MPPELRSLRRRYIDMTDDMTLEVLLFTTRFKLGQLVTSLENIHRYTIDAPVSNTLTSLFFLALFYQIDFPMQRVRSLQYIHRQK